MTEYVVVASSNNNNNDNGLLAYNTDSTCNAMSIKNDIEYKQFVQ